jgi:hypothetical protein
MKKQVLAAITCAVLSVGAGSGCKQVTTTGGMTDVASKDLGVPVFLWAMEGDVCASRQLKALFNDYGSRSAAERAQLADKFKGTYKALVILATKDLGDTTGELKMVQLLDRRHVADTKIIVDTRNNASHQAPGVVVDKGDASSVEGRVVSLRPFSSADKSDKQLYTTTDSASFGRLAPQDAPADAGASADALNLQDAIDSGVVTLVPNGFTDADPCGKLATVSDLL